VKKQTHCSLATCGWDDRTKKMCCFSKLPRYENYIEMHKDVKVISLLDDLSNGVKNIICDTCWSAEERGELSMRQQSLQNEGTIKKEEVLEQECNDKKLKYLVIDSGTQCNLACRTCGPYSSTAHVKEWEIKNKKTYTKKSSNPIGLLDQNLSSVKTIEVLGGEPFLNLEHLRILDTVKNNSPYWLTYTTNGTVRLRNDILEKFSAFKAVNISLSIDAVGKPFEYIRTLGEWEKIEKNVQILFEQKNIHKHLSVNCHITVSALNVLYITMLIDWLNERNITFDYTYCEHPLEYSLKIFNDQQKNYITDKLKERKQTEPIIQYLQNSTPNEKLIKTFKEAVDFTKKYRNLALEDYLPELHRLIM
jgi:MoaA/NifB/PqqE/SkfB family radical SAM enzyme